MTQIVEQTDFSHVTVACATKQRSPVRDLTASEIESVVGAVHYHDSGYTSGAFHNIGEVNGMAFCAEWSGTVWVTCTMRRLSPFFWVHDPISRSVTVTSLVFPVMHESH